MLTLKHALALGVVTAVSAIAPKTTGSPLLRFQKVQSHATAHADGEFVKVQGKPVPLSTAMKCVMSLLFLYFIVVVIQKAIIFTRQMKAMYADAKADLDLARAAMGIPEIKVPEMSTEDKIKVKAAELVVKNRAAAAMAMVPGAGAAKDMFMSMFDETKLAEMQTSMGMIPMFCILITFGRLRARVDLETEPQPLMKNFMVVSTTCLFIEILIVMIPECAGKPSTSCCTAAKACTYVKKLLGLFVLIGLYAGIGVIVHQIFTLTYKYDEDMKSKTADAAANAAAATPAATTAPAAGSEAASL